MPLFVSDLDDTLCNTTRDIRGSVERICNLTLVPGAREFLDAHGRETILLSAGNRVLQHQKIRVLDLDPVRTFKKIEIVLTHEAKLKAICNIVASCRLNPKHIVVIGDRIDQEIAIGNRLGCTTVRVCLPEGKYSGRAPKKSHEYPHHTIADFFELTHLLGKMEHPSSGSPE